MKTLNFKVKATQDNGELFVEGWAVKYNVIDDSSTIVVFTHSMFISACISIIAVRGTSANFMDINNNILPKSPDDVVFHLPNGSITIFDCQIDINQKNNNPENEVIWRCLSTGYDGYFDYPHKITSGRWW